MKNSIKRSPGVLLLPFPVLVIAVILLQLSPAAQRPDKDAPATPSAAYKRATEPLRDWLKLTEPTLELNLKAINEQERRAREYSSLFKSREWKGEELLELGRLYNLANQPENAEMSLKAYLRESAAEKKTIAHQQLLNALNAQKKWNDAVSVASDLLDETAYDQDIINSTQALIEALRATNLRQAVILSEKRLPRLLTYAEGNLKNPGHAAWVLDLAMELGALYREAGEKPKSDQFYTSLLSRFRSGPLASEERVRIGVESALQRARLIGAAAPPIAAVEYIDMQPRTISELKGKVILLDFLAHWCAPCIESFPYLDVLQRKYEASGLVVLGVTSYYGFFGSKEKVSPAEELAELKALKADHRVRFGFIVGPRANETAYGIAGLPAYGLIDRNGRVQYLEPGTTAQQKLRLEQMIQRLVRQPEHRR